MPPLQGGKHSQASMGLGGEHWDSLACPHLALSALYYQLWGRGEAGAVPRILLARRGTGKKQGSVLCPGSPGLFLLQKHLFI